MGVGIDAAGHDEQAVGVDHARVGRRVEVRSHGLDEPVDAEDIRGAFLVVGDHRAALDVDRGVGDSNGRGDTAGRRAASDGRVPAARHE